MLGNGKCTTRIGKVGKDLNKNCSVQGLATFEVECIIRECLFAFPYMWASVSLLIDDSCLIMLVSFQPSVGESQLF